jgi:hypothetical protein
MTGSVNASDCPAEASRPGPSDGSGAPYDTSHPK